MPTSVASILLHTKGQTLGRTSVYILELTIPDDVDENIAR